MPNPWDPLPFPTRGDDDDRLTFEGVGRVISHWEAVEFELARLYSAFVGDPDGEPMQKGYGQGRIFQDRLRIARLAASKWFIEAPDQHAEAGFDHLAFSAEKFAERRNEVAHGIVFRVQNMTYFRNRFGLSADRRSVFALIPPLYTLRKHDNATGMPTYAYASVELQTLTDRLLSLVVDTRSYREAFFGRNGLPPASS